MKSLLLSYGKNYIKNSYVEILNKLIYLKKQLHELKMSKENDIKDHINNFNMYISFVKYRSQN